MIIPVTGNELWLEEFASRYYTFKNAGADIVLASPKGGQPPVDPKSDELKFQTIATLRFKIDAAAKEQFAATERLDSISQSEFETIFYPGGRGPMWDILGGALRHCNVWLQIHAYYN